MAALDPEHLFEQAEKLILAPPAGPPRQVDLRRAISAAYYGLFHFVLTAVADEFVGKSKRGTPLYELAYRNVDHRAFKSLCVEVAKTSPAAKYAPYLPPAGMGPNMQAFAAFAADLQDRRHVADYNPTPRFRTADAQIVIATARSAVRRFHRAKPDRRKAFLTLLLFPPR